MLADPAVDYAAKDAPNYRSHDEQPKLAERPTARERGRPDAARRIDRGIGHGNAGEVYGEHSPGHYDVLSCFFTEVVMTIMFLFIIMGSTHGRAPVGFAPIAIGLGLTLIDKESSRD